MSLKGLKKEKDTMITSVNGQCQQNLECSGNGPLGMTVGLS